MKRLLVPLCIVMAILILVIGMTTVSFSWFEPDIKEGIGLEFKDNTKLRAQECTIATYEGSKGNKMVTYATDTVADENVTISASGSGDTTTPSYKYYKTVITNGSKDYDTVVSLFLPSFTPSSGNASICVAIPTNSCRTFTSAQTDIHIIRNAYVPKRDEADANPGQLVVEWFVKCDAGSVTFNPSQVFLMYN